MKTNKDDSFESWANKQIFTNGVNGQLRPNSVLHPSNTKKDLMSDSRIEIDMKESELANCMGTGFNATHEYDNNVYCIELIIAIYKINCNSQNECKQLFKNLNHLNAPCIYKYASITTKQTCQVKAALEYADCAFSQTACILDFLGCNVIFETQKDLVSGLSKLISYFKHCDKADEYADDTIQHVMKKILRNKNGFHVLCFGMPKFGMPKSGMPKLWNAKSENAKIGNAKNYNFIIVHLDNDYNNSHGNNIINTMWNNINTISI